jgi:TPR repeat protein
MYREGEGVPQNYAEALKWFRKAADQGNANAQFKLGIMYRRFKSEVQQCSIDSMAE